MEAERIEAIASGAGAPEPGAEARARSVLAEAAARGLAPTPEVYALLWTWLDGDDAALAEAVARDLAPGRATPEAAVRLHAAHLAAPDAGAELVRLGELLGAEMAQVSASLARRVAADGEFHGRLAEAREGIGAFSRPSTVRRVVRDLLEVAEGHAEQTELFQAELDLAHRQIEELRGELGAAREAATRDPLTGLGNRRRFEAALRAALETGGAVSVVVADLDRFKRINDLHGHPVGDSVLRRFAETLRESLRGRDVAARIGGEEFALLLPGANALAARHTAERVRQNFASRTLRVRETGERLAGLSASFGVAERAPGEAAEALVARADAALYRAKRNGRNRVASAE